MVGPLQRAACALVCVVLLASCASSQRHAAPVAPLPRDGVAEWIDVPGGRLKTRAYSTETLSAHPTLVVFVHGDVPIPHEDQYIFSQLFAEGAGAPEALLSRVRTALGDALVDDLATAAPSTDVVVVGVVRPGYSDAEGDTSDGEQGMALADNYTPEVVDAVAAAVARLKAEYSAGAVVMVGHSGGGAIAADLLGRHPDAADGALLIACGCDPVAWRDIMRTGQFADLDWSHPYRSLSPMDLATSVAADTKVRLLAGDNDDTVPPEHTLAYAQALASRGLDVQATIAPGYGHNDISFSPLAFDTLKALIEDVR